MSHALLLLGHAERGSFNTALADAYADGLASAGIGVERLALADLSFDPVLRAGYRQEQGLEPDLLRAREAIERARHLVWAFPTYWASPPAVVRGFVDRLFVPGWAFRFREGKALPDGLLAGRSARLIVTMDSPSWWYALAHRRAVHASMGTATLSYCGVSPVRSTTVHSVRELDAKQRAAWLDRLRAQGHADARPLRPRALTPRAA